ncbi:MAG: copper chaperone PCu(A)C [Reyranellaceae bacterium]
MFTRRFLLASTLAALLASPALGHDYKLGALSIAHPWARATVGPVGGAFLSIENKGATADRLVSAASPVAKTVEIHNHIKDGDVMRMRAVDGIDLPAGGKVELKPGGYHIMLMGLSKPLKEGERFPVTLQFEKAGKIDVEIAVDKPGASEPAHGQHKH